MKWLQEKMRNSYLAAKDRRAKGEKGGMEITTVIGLVVVAIVVLVLVKNMFVKTTNTMTDKTQSTVNGLYDEKNDNQSVTKPQSETKP